MKSEVNGERVKGVDGGERQLVRLGFAPPFYTTRCARIKTFASWSTTQAGRGEEGKKRRPASPGGGEACLGALNRQKGGRKERKRRPASCGRGEAFRKMGLAYKSFWFYII